MSDWYIFAVLGGSLGLVGLGIGWLVQKVPEWRDQREIRRILRMDDLAAMQWAIQKRRFPNTTAWMEERVAENSGALNRVTIYGDTPRPATVQWPTDPSPKPRQNRRAFSR